MTGSSLSITSSVLLGSGWSPTGLAVVEPASKLVVFYEYEGIYYIVDEGPGNAVVSVSTGKRYYSAVYIVGS